MKNILILFLLFTSFAFSQNVEGIVKDKDSGAPLEGVHISSAMIQRNTFSDKEGKYRITPKENISGNDSISFSSVGYLSQNFSFSELQATRFEVLLTPATEELKEVNLHMNRPLKPSLGFKQLAEMETAVYDFSSVVAGEKIYVLAGNASFIEDPIQDEVNRKMGMVSFKDLIRASQRDFTLEAYSDKIQVYDIQRDEWEVSPLPIRKRAGHTAVLHQNKIYIVGGKNLQMAGKKEFLDDKIEILDLEKDTVVLDHVNPHQAIGATAFTYKGNLMILGGSFRINRIGNKIFSDEVHLLNFQSGLWFNAGKMTTGKETVGIRVEDELYLVGGNDGRHLSKIEVLDLKSGLWEDRATFPRALKDPSVTAHDGIIYIYEKSNFFTYNIHTEELQLYDIHLKVEGPGLHYANEKLYLLGGFVGNDYTRSPENNCYSIDLEEFHTTAVLSYSK